ELAKIDCIHVPYKGSGDVFNALSAGTVQAISETSGWAPFVDAGKFRLLAVYSEHRLKRWPVAPTLREQGYDIADAVPWGIVGPVTELLVASGHSVRALVRREDERAQALRELGAVVVQGDLTDLDAMHRAIDGCRRIYFGMSVSPQYLEATVNTAAVTLHHGVEAFVNMSQMTVSQMS